MAGGWARAARLQGRDSLRARFSRDLGRRRRGDAAAVAACWQARDVRRPWHGRARCLIRCPSLLPHPPRRRVDPSQSESIQVDPSRTRQTAPLR